MDSRTPDAELEILKLLWEKQPLSARELAQLAYKSLSPTTIGTVQKLLQRLEAKSLVTRDRSAHAHTFSTTITREEFAGRQMEVLADKLTDGSLAPILMHLVQVKKLSSSERSELLRLLEQPTQRGKSR